MKGVLTMGIKQPKEVTKRNAENGYVKEDYIVEYESEQSLFRAGTS